MGGLREKKKKQTEKKILKVSKEIFLSKGYSGTTMDEIAKKAEIGVGTLYNYFKSKAVIFIAIMAEDAIIAEIEPLKVEEELESNVSTILTDYIWKSLKNMNLFSKKIWKELIAAVFHNANSNQLILKGMVSFDFKFIEKLELLFDQLKEKGMLKKDFNSSEGSYAVYSLLITQFMLYVYKDEITPAILKKQIGNQINFLMDGKCKGIVEKN